MEKRRAESAGTFNVASEKVKPRISHTREPRLSKMQLLIKVSQTLYPRIQLDKHFTYIFTQDLMQLVTVFLQELLPWTHFTSNYTAIAVSCFISTIMCDASRQNWYTVILLLHPFHTGVQHMPSDLLEEHARERPLIAREADICICCNSKVLY